MSSRQTNNQAHGPSNKAKVQGGKTTRPAVPLPPPPKKK